MRLVELFWDIIDGEESPREVLTLDGRFAVPDAPHPATKERESSMKSADQEAVIGIFNDLYGKIAEVGNALAAHIANDALTVPDVQGLIDASIASAAAGDVPFDTAAVTGFVPAPAPVAPAAVQPA